MSKKAKQLYNFFFGCKQFDVSWASRRLYQYYARNVTEGLALCLYKIFSSSQKSKLKIKLNNYNNLKPYVNNLKPWLILLLGPVLWHDTALLQPGHQASLRRYLWPWRDRKSVWTRRRSLSKRRRSLLRTFPGFNSTTSNNFKTLIRHWCQDNNPAMHWHLEATVCEFSFEFCGGR